MVKCLPYKMFRNFKVPKGADDVFFTKASEYKPREGQVVIVSYPKCGTTWLQHIVYLLLNKGEPATSISQVISAVPFPEQDGFPPEGIEEKIAIKSHLPFHLTKLEEKALYIYITRNPKDTCVSYYHFLKKLPGYSIGNFEEFYYAFLEGELPYGDFVDHFSGWYNKRQLPNILFITYESLFQERKVEILKIAKFMGLGQLDSETLENVIKYSDFEYMKRLADGDSFMLRYLKKSTRLEEKVREEEEKTPTIMRKGIVGDWRNYFDQELSDRMKKSMLSKSGGENILELWKEAFIHPYE